MLHYKSKQVTFSSTQYVTNVSLPKHNKNYTLEVLQKMLNFFQVCYPQICLPTLKDINCLKLIGKYLLTQYLIEVKFITVHLQVNVNNTIETSLPICTGR